MIDAALYRLFMTGHFAPRRIRERLKLKALASRLCGSRSIETVRIEGYDAEFYH